MTSELERISNSIYQLGRLDASRNFSDNLEGINKRMEPLHIVDYLLVNHGPKCIAYIRTVEHQQTGQEFSTLGDDALVRQLEKHYAGTLDKLADDLGLELVTFDLEAARKGYRKI